MSQRLATQIEQDVADPDHPWGLGIVEAGLSALLILAGVPGGDAVVATLGYRIISYWLPMVVGPFAYLAFRLRYGSPGAGSGAGPALDRGVDGRPVWRGQPAPMRLL